MLPMAPPQAQLCYSNVMYLTAIRLILALPNNSNLFPGRASGNYWGAMGCGKRWHTLAGNQMVWRWSAVPMDLYPAISHICPAQQQVVF
jgi:hypothetical protein